MHDCTFTGLRTEAHLCLCPFSLPSSIHPSCPLSHYVVMKLTKVLPSSTVLSSISVCSIWSASFPPLPSPSALYRCPVMQLTANLSSSLILSSSSSFSDFFFYSPLHQPLLLFPPTSFSFPCLLFLFSFPFFWFCATGHAVNNKGKQVVVGHWVDLHGTLSLWISQTCTDAQRHGRHSQAFIYHL